MMQAMPIGHYLGVILSVCCPHFLQAIDICRVRSQDRVNCPSTALPVAEPPPEIPGQHPHVSTLPLDVARNHTIRYGMAMATKERWLDAGLQLLSQEGITALRIDRLAAALTLSKGSFYHHFAGISGYRLDLLDYYEDRCTTRHIRFVDAAAEHSPNDKLDVLRQVVVADDQWGPELDIAVRAWASQDDDARAMQERVDATRMAYLESILQGRTGDRQLAHDLSRLLYLLLVGSHHVLPALPISEVGRLYDIVLKRAEEDLR